jgi:anthranilate phosphoribosyltransferase
MKPYEVLTVCGSEYHLKITTANAVKLEEALKTDILQGLDRMSEINILAKYYYAAAVSQNDSINTIDDVYQLFDDYITDGGTYEKLQELLVKVLLVSGILTEKMYETSKKLKEKQGEALQKLLN